MKNKICTQCNKLKTLDDFYNDKSKKDRKSCKCKKCIQENRNDSNYKKRHKKYMKKYNKENKEKLEEYHKNWRKNNKEKKNLWVLKNKSKNKRYNKKSRNKEALYDTYAHQISWCEDVKRNLKNKDYLQVRCTESSCRKWFSPTVQEVCDRIKAINGKSRGAQRFYCSKKCKKSCSIFHQIKYPKNFKENNNLRDSILQSEWSKLVKEQDKNQCIICGTKEKLEAHHIEGQIMNPIESADIDIGVTLCKECHKKIHSYIGCRYIDLKKEILCGGNL